MFRTLLRAVLILVLIVGLAAFFIGYEFATPDADGVIGEPAVGTSGTRPANPAIDRDGPGGVDVDAARDAGAAIAERVATGANEAGRVLSSAALTARIKSKMALDDTIDANYIDVDTSGSTVTLSGTVESDAQRTRALQLARETEGVSSVVDRLQLR